MKKALILVIIMSLLLCAAGCTDRNEDAETTEPGTSGTVAPGDDGNAGDDEGPATGSDINTGEDIGEVPDDVETDENTEYPLLIGDGGTVFADLDGDGKQEEICLKSSVEGRDVWLFGSFEINGEEFADAIYELGFTGTTPADTYAITDIDESDGKLEVAIQDLGPSSDLTTSFFRYENGELSYLGTVSGMIDEEEAGSQKVSFDGAGKVGAVMRLSTLQTWFAPVEYTIDDSGKLQLVEQELYTSSSTNEITTLVEINVYASADTASAATALPAGTKLTVKGTDNSEWVLAEREDGSECWINLVGGYAVQTGTEYTYCWDVFDGLILAD